MSTDTNKHELQYEKLRVILMKQDVKEFEKFHRLLTMFADDYSPWYFVLEKNGKDPLPARGSWKAPQSQLSFEKAKRWLEHGYNIGIAGTDKDPLVIVDIDDWTQVQEKDVKPTLSIRSRSRIGTHHLYFTSDKPCNREAEEPVPSAKMNIPTEDAGEVRSVWQYVVAPGSFVPCYEPDYKAMPEDQYQYAGYYTLENCITPMPITFSEFPEVFQRHAIKALEDEKAEQERPKKEHGKNSKESQLFSLHITDIVGKYPDGQRFPSLFHGSHTGKNASLKDDLLHCWRHNVSHNALTALAVLAGVVDCKDAGYPHMNSMAGPSSVDTDNGEMIYQIWKFAKEEGYLPADDPMPAAALRWFAIEMGLCTQNDLIDGWKLPMDAFMDAKMEASSLGI